MLRASLLLIGGLALLSSAAFVAVGSRLRQRAVTAGSEGAQRAFAMWWSLVGAHVFVVGFTLNVVAGLGFEDARLFHTIRSLSFVLLLAALWHLASYLAFLFTGSMRWRFALGIAYAVIYAATNWTFSAGAPTGVLIGAYETRIVYTPPPDALGLLVITLALGAPQVLGALGYLALLPRVKDRTHRYRVVLVSLSLASWFAASMLAAIGDLDAPVLLLRPLLGLAAAGAVVGAYAPPAWVQRRFHVEALSARRSDPSANAGDAS